jgi:hypothetical protein
MAVTGDEQARDAPTTSASSADTAAAAGWAPGDQATYPLLLRARFEPPWDRFSWRDPRILLWVSRNDKLARLRPGYVDRLRARWMETQRETIAARFPGLLIDRSDLAAPRIALLGDPGEADGSQYATVAPLRASCADTDFMVIVSDVTYPAGDPDEYVNGHFIPYQGYGKEIYALPGNHDWYAELVGFMHAFCGAPPLPPAAEAPPAGLGERLARLLWRRPGPLDRDLLRVFRARMASWADAPAPVQPGPYWAIDTGPLRIVGIDTGIEGTLDRAQGEWLLEVSRGRDVPKVLLTGKPLIVNGEYEPGRIDWGEDGGPTIDDIVRDERHRYVAAIGGDIHNYQRYPVRLRRAGGGTRPLQYIVAGGSGAFLTATHTIDRIDGVPDLPDGVALVDKLPPQVRADWAAGVAERDFVCYPKRGDSLARTSRRWAPTLRRYLLALVALLALGLATWLAPLPDWGRLPARLIGTAALAAAAPLALVALFMLPVTLGVVVLGGRVDPDVAARWIANRLALEPVRVAARTARIGWLARLRLQALLPPRRRFSKLLALLRAPADFLLYSTTASAIFDDDDPPLFKSFLRLDVDGDRLTITCLGVTGRERDAQRPAVEDRVEIDLPAAGPPLSR